MLKLSNTHKQWVGEIFDRAAPTYGKNSSSFFSYFGKRLVELTDIQAGYHVLDVATGTGAVLLPAAKKVGFTGRVTRIDLSQQMLNETKVEVESQNLNWVSLMHMDGEHLDFADNSFDSVFCGFALFFIPSISKAIAEFKRVLKVGGTLAVSTWGKDSELDEWLNHQITSLGSTQGAITTPLWNGDVLKKALEESFGPDVCIIEETKQFVHESPKEWWNSLWSHATRARLEQLSPSHLHNLQISALKKANGFCKDNVLHEDLQAFYGIAKKL